MAISTDEKILGLALLAEKHQKSMSEAITALNETLRDFRMQTNGLSEKTQQQLNQGIRTVDIGKILGGRLSDSLSELNQQVSEGKRQIQSANAEISEARREMHREFFGMKKQRVWVMVPSFMAGLLVGGAMIFLFLGGLSAQGQMYQDLAEQFSAQLAGMEKKIDNIQVKQPGRR
ncbi:hypothetical protein AB7X32_22000 [Morganella morganii]|uniref:hypothetical protein n=1 Tax=Morganella morganii TaxID=582 RepID=UPI0034E5E0E1